MNMVSVVSKTFFNDMISKHSFSKSVNFLLLIKDWDNLMGLNSRRWLYRGREIQQITRNWVVIVVSSVHLVGTTLEDAHLFVVGPGIYSIAFRYEGGIVSDSRDITGMILSPHLLDIISSAKREYEGAADLVLNEHTVEIPFSIIEKPLSVQDYERGILAVKVFTTYKDAFKELEKRCSDPESYPKEHGLKILSSSMEFANRVLIGSEMGEWAKRKVAKYVDPPDILKLASSAREYMMDIPGLVISQPGIDDVFLTRFLIQGVAGGYLGENSQLLRSTNEIKSHILEREIPRVASIYCGAKNSIAGGLF
jgi:hypothetical protein